MANDPIINDLTVTVTGVVAGFAPVNVSTVVSLEPVRPAPTPTPTPTPTPPPNRDGQLSVEVAYQGRSYFFEEVEGEDLGDYTDPAGAFIQGCVLTRHPDFPGLTVQFRRDKTSDREEVVLELGDTTQGVEAANLGEYIATIWCGTTMRVMQSVPCHYWYSRWRWQSAPRPVSANIEALQDCGWLPRFDTELATTRKLSPARSYEVMGLAGLTAYVPATGERDEIGLVTEAQAEFLRGDAPASSLLAQGEASGTFPWHYRDEQGGGIFNFVTHPDATVYGGPAATIPWCACDVTLDSAHEPPLAYVPFILTGDPYYLEELQFAATYNVLCSGPPQRSSFNLGHAVRAHAWSLRVLAQCATVTPADVPVWLQPRSYWKDWLDQERDWMLSRYVNPTASPYTEVPYAVFNFMLDATNSPATTTLPAGTYVSPWQEDFEAAVLCHVVMLGHSDWRPILEWKLQNTIARTDGKSGWERATTTVYTLALRETDEAPYVEDWPTCWDLNVMMQPDDVAFDAPDTIPRDDSLTYASYCLSALALATALGVRGAADCHRWLREQIAVNSDANTWIDRKWTITGD